MSDIDDQTNLDASQGLFSTVASDNVEIVGQASSRASEGLWTVAPKPILRPRPMQGHKRILGHRQILGALRTGAPQIHRFRIPLISGPSFLMIRILALMISQIRRPQPSRTLGRHRIH